MVVKFQNERKNMSAVPFQPKQALFELTMQNAEAADLSFDDIIVQGLKRNIPPEIMTRLSELWSATKVVAGEVVAIGKIIVRKILDFLLENSGLAIGIAIGAAVTAMVAGIPLIGGLLAPLVGVVSMLYGAGAGAAIQNGENPLDPIVVARTLARKFFDLLFSIFNGVKDYWVQEV